MPDVFFDELHEHIVAVHNAIVAARTFVSEQTHDNQIQRIRIQQDVHHYLRQGQDKIDTILDTLDERDYQRYKTIAGEPVHGYMFACYKIGSAYYGHADFGHPHCHGKAQKSVESIPGDPSIPIDEFLTFLRDTPKAEHCVACGEKLITREA
jgi:hypothetical protein